MVCSLLKLVRRGVLSSLCAGIILTGSSCNSYMSQYRKEYGTISHPKYSIICEANSESISQRNYKDNDFEELEFFEDRLAKFESLEKLSLEDRAYLINHSFSNDNWNLRQKFYDTAELNASISYREKEKFYGDIRELSKEIFQGLTGNQFPKDYNFVELKNGAGVPAGQFDFLGRNIFFLDRGYEKSLKTIVHEMGHLIYQGSESQKSLRVQEIKVIEETCANLFSLAGKDYISKKFEDLSKNLDFLLSIEQESYLEDFVLGNYGRYEQSWALTDSLIDYFGGDLMNAFNYISTKENFSEVDSSILENFENLKAGFSFSRKEYYKKILELSERKIELLCR